MRDRIRGEGALWRAALHVELGHFQRPDGSDFDPDRKKSSLAVRRILAVVSAVTQMWPKFGRSLRHRGRSVRGRRPTPPPEPAHQWQLDQTPPNHFSLPTRALLARPPPSASRRHPPAAATSFFHCCPRLAGCCGLPPVACARSSRQLGHRI
jgi:hypothetical protein